MAFAGESEAIPLNDRPDSSAIDDRSHSGRGTSTSGHLPPSGVAGPAAPRSVFDLEHNAHSGISFCLLPGLQSSRELKGVHSDQAVFLMHWAVFDLAHNAHYGVFLCH